MGREVHDSKQPMNTSQIAPASGETLLGRRLLHRIVLREKLRLQIRFLEELSQSSGCQDFILYPGCQDFILYGGAALHGVYLHGRLSEDLDLIAPPSIKGSFLAVMATHGLCLEERDGLIPVYTRIGTLGTPIGIGIGTSVRPDSGIPCERRPFGFLAGRTVLMRVLPLAHMLAEKLNCVTYRARAVDFVDLWLGFHSGPAAIDEMFAAFRARQPYLSYDRAAALDHLGSLRADWEGPLEPLLLRVPAYEEVRRDLEAWLCRT